MASSSMALGSAAIVGIAVGGSLLAFVILSMSIALFFRWRERHMLLDQHKTWRMSHGRHDGVREGDYSAISGLRNSYYRTPSSPYNSPERNRQRELYRAQACYRPSLLESNNAPVPAAGRLQNGRLTRLSWPLPSKKPVRLPVTFGRFKLKPLSPINESPVSQSKSNAELMPPKKLSSSSGKNADKTHPRREPPTTSDVTREGQENSQIINPVVVPRSTPLYEDTHARTEQKSMAMLQRSKSDSYKLPKNTSHIVTGDNMSRPTLPRSLSLHGLDSRTFPQDAVPSLPLDARQIRRAGLCILASQFHQRYPPSPISTVSAGTSILNLDASPFMLRPESSTLGAHPTSCSPSSSMTSDGLSIFEEAISKWESVSGTGLSSPPKKQRSQGYISREPSDSSLRNKGHGQVADTPSSGRVIHEGSRISLATLGRGDSLRSASDTVKENRGGRHNPGHGSNIDAISVKPFMTVRNRPRASSDLVANAKTLAFEHREKRRASGGRTEDNEPLRHISGNQVDPFQNRRRPRESSMAPDRQQLVVGHEYKPPTSPAKPISVLKTSVGRRIGHRRQNCVRISHDPPLVLGAGSCSPIYEEPIQGRSIAWSRSSARYSRLGESRCLTISPSGASFHPPTSPTPRSRFNRERHVDGDMGLRSNPPTGLYQLSNRLAPDSKLHYFHENSQFASSPTSIFYSPTSSQTRITPSDSKFTFTLGRISPVRPLKTIKHPGPSPQTAHFGTATCGGLTTPPRGRRHRSGSVIRGPRTPPSRISRSPRSKEAIHRSVVAIRRMNSEATSNDGSRERSRTSSNGKPTTNSQRYPSTEANQHMEGGSHSVVFKEEFSPPKNSPVKSSSLQHQMRMEITAARNSKLFEMPNPRVDRRIGLGLTLSEEELYDQNGFLRF